MHEHAYALTPVEPARPLGELELSAGALSQAAADQLAALTARAAGAPAAMIHLATAGALRYAGGVGLPAQFDRQRYAPARSTLAGWVIANDHPLIVTDAELDHRVPPDAPVRAAGIRAYAGFPIRDPEGETVGVCAVLDRRPRPWTAAELTAVDEGAQACMAFVCERRAREDADRQHRFLDALLESLRTGVAACDADGRLVFTNEAVRRLCGGCGADGLAATGPLRRALAGERLRGLELTVSRPGERARVLSADAEPITDRDGTRTGAVIAVHDVTERRRAERFREAELGVAGVLAGAQSAAEAGPELLRVLAEPLDWPHAELWLVDAESGVLVPAATWTAPGSPVRIRVPRLLRRGHGLAGTAWRSGERVWVHGVGAEGSLVSADAVEGPPPGTALAVPIASGGRTLAVLTGFAGAAEDPADALVVLLSGIAAHIGQFLERRRAEDLAVALARSKDEYLALVGHELRTPLTSISACVELLRDGDPDLVPELVAAMDRNAETLRHIIDELLDLAALDSGHAEVAADPVDLTGLVAGAVHTVSAAAAEAGVTIEAALAPDVTVPGDAARLAQVVIHLLDNAIRHSPDGGRVTVALTSPAAASVELTVADAGLGIPEDERDRLFTRFYRSTRTRDRGIRGAGLGLALSRAVIDRHHGTIRLVPQPAGTRFVVRLPAHADSDAAQPVQRVTSTATSPPRSSKCG
ncbi:ATP-binding protein [Dactylosporangium sp. CA-052675]|uniref:ATP-binding protein n=1 Tax=Dactylosporangium sp. CA-052675 TaxID=3239927 RepID=UPI003D8BFCF2